ncbi:hypothetical protein [Kordia sp.]|uniref:hypothetical protein n=1 Tax=Kordia sp. TaxID=1965332 RepID=UPI003B5B0DC9
MSFFKRLKSSFLDIVEEEFPEDYVDDGKEYHIIPEPYDFTYSSVKGDFRLARLSNGFCASWKNFIISRDWDGNKLYTIRNYGRSVAISPDKTKLVTSSQNKGIAIFDAKTGDLIDSGNTEDFVSDLVWTKNNFIVGTNSDAIFVLDTECNPVRTIKQKDGSDFDFISGITLHAENESYITVLESNGNRISIINFETEEIVKTKELRNSGELFYSEAHQKFWIPYERKEFVLTLDEDLEEVKRLYYTGKKGVKHSGQDENDYSCTAWATLPALSPNGRRFLVNDRSGLLMLISAHSDDECYRTFTRDVIDYAYAMLWQDDDHFIALLDNHRVVKVNIRGKEHIFHRTDS